MSDTGTSAQSDGFENVSPAAFIRRVLHATTRTAFKGGPAFKLGIEPTPDKRLKVVLIDGTDAFRAFIDGPPPSEIDRPRVGVIDQDRALEIIVGVLDLMARDVWQTISDGRPLSASDTAFLQHWTDIRTSCSGRMAPDEAQRLFGDAPSVTERNQAFVGIDLLIDWEGPERVLGDDADYLRRKQHAQEAFARAVSGAEEKFISQCFEAYLRAINRRTRGSV